MPIVIHAHRIQDPQAGQVPLIRKYNSSRQGQPYPLPARYRKFNTTYYARYDTANPNNNRQWNGMKFGTTKNYRAHDHYQLLNETNISHLKAIPHQVRLCDYAAGIVVLNCDRPKLHQRAPRDFDTKGMIRASRHPLGHAGKQYFDISAADRDGHVMQPGQGGWYYVLYKGIHPLVGKEGENHYLSHGTFAYEYECLFTFVIDPRWFAANQSPPGHPSDTDWQ